MKPPRPLWVILTTCTMVALPVLIPLLAKLIHFIRK